ncbi:MAG: c-type cytochrome biogenesis protein CcsB, partial [Betaproteobacteria bacterium]|nr:c-type cytochrome biogenesis protein CcsB [Betaproteobacteria bacterium]
MNTTVSLNPGYFSQRRPLDWAFAVLTLIGTLFAFVRYQHAMDVYEQVILLCCGPALVGLGWFWRPLRNLMAVVTLLALWAIWSY